MLLKAHFFFLICKNKTQGQGCFELSRVTTGSLTRRRRLMNSWRILEHTCFWVQRKKRCKVVRIEEAPSGHTSAGGQDDSVFWAGSLSRTGRKMSLTLKTWVVKLPPFISLKFLLLFLSCSKNDLRWLKLKDAYSLEGKL